ncbi:MAG TPA: PDZ domain-containing protein [Candidatus Polarisedimenticolia bacterium]|nr:PDZ domain-containing protein [Candidatus Polarisedimenticolia bacterium]
MFRRAVMMLGLTVLSLVLLLAVVQFASAGTPHAAPQPPPPPPGEEDEPGDTPEPGEAPDPFFYFNSGGSWLGVSLADITSERAKELKLKEEMGAEIKAVLPGSPAEEAGLKEADVILQYHGTRVEGVAQLTRMVRETPPGRTIDLQLSRGGATQTVRVKVSERHGEHGDVMKRVVRHRGPHFEMPPIDIDIPDIPDLPGPGFRPSFRRLGAEVEDLDEQLGEYFGVKDGEGVLVRSVVKGGPGETAGLRAGDVIIKVDGEKMGDASDLRLALRERRGKEVALTILRDKREQTLKVTLPKGDRPGAEEVGSTEWKEDIERKLDQAHRRMKSLHIEIERNLTAPHDVI